MSTSFERRKHYRHKFFEKIKVECSYGPFDPQTFEGLIVNISELGICILTTRKLANGQEVTFKDLNGSTETARVEWVEKADGQEYKAGLLFIK